MSCSFLVLVLQGFLDVLGQRSQAKIRSLLVAVKGFKLWGDQGGYGYMKLLRQQARTQQARTCCNTQVFQNRCAGTLPADWIAEAGILKGVLSSEVGVLLPA